MYNELLSILFHFSSVTFLSLFSWALAKSNFIILDM